VLVAAFTFLVGMLGAKERSRESFGDYATYVLIYSIGMTFATAGVNQVVQKLGADDGRRRAFASLAYRGLLALSALAAIAAPAVGLLFGWKLALGVVNIPLLTFWHWTRSIVRSRFEAKYEALLLVVASLSKSLTQLAFITMSDVDAALIYGDFLGTLGTAVFSFAFLPRALGLSLRSIAETRIERPLLVEMVAFGWPLWIAGEVYSVRSSIISAYTRGALGSVELAAYSMSEQVLRIAVKPSEFFGQAALPGLVRAEADRSAVYRRAAGFAVLVFPSLGVATAALSPVILEVFGVASKYPEVPSILFLMATMLPASAVETTLIQFTVAAGQSRAILFAHVLTLLAMGALLYPMGEAFGLIGVVAVASLAHLSYLVGLLIALAKSHRAEVNASLRVWLVAQAACVALVGGLYVLRDAPYAFLFAVPAVVAYVAALVLSGTIRLPRSVADLDGKESDGGT
jgi:O-antigen/teichoic acid export membrane protein